MNKYTLVETSNTLIRKRLQNAILHKKKIYIQKKQRFDLLKGELDLIKREYLIRVGSLFSRDNHLDMQIIKYKTILDLLRRGLSYGEALARIEKEQFADELEDSDFSRYEMPTIEESEATSKKKDEQLRRLWKKAVMKFHPDLVSDSQEKKIRENIMKMINKAYNEGNYDELEKMYNNNHVKGWHESTIEELEKILFDVENSIILVTNELLQLRSTEWYSWKKKIQKAKKEGLDVFKEIEDSLLDDIVRKTRILSGLKTAVAEKK